MKQKKIIRDFEKLAQHLRTVVNDFDEKKVTRPLVVQKRRWGPKRLVESCARMDLRVWRKEGLLIPGTQFTWPPSPREAERLRVTVEEASIALHSTAPHSAFLSQRIPLTSTSCHYGGVRYWFACPALIEGRPCGRRVAVLYRSAAVFRCRHCADLGYRSQTEDRLTRLAHRARRLYARLGGIWEANAPLPPKPPHMQWRTYTHVAQHILEIQLALFEETDKQRQRLQQKGRGGL